MTLGSIKEDFALLDGWEDRYRYVIELGKTLAPLEAFQRTEQNKVRGCASQVWLVTTAEKRGVGEEPRLQFAGESDAMIVSGLIAILFAIFQNRTPSEIAALDAHSVFNELGLHEHLTPQRSNGVASMIRRIKADGQAAARL